MTPSRFAGSVSDSNRVFGLPRKTPIEFEVVGDKIRVFVPEGPGHKSIEGDKELVIRGIENVRYIQRPGTANEVERNTPEPPK